MAETKKSSRVIFEVDRRSQFLVKFLSKNPGLKDGNSYCEPKTNLLSSVKTRRENPLCTLQRLPKFAKSQIASLHKVRTASVSLPFQSFAYFFFRHNAKKFTQLPTDNNLFQSKIFKDNFFTNFQSQFSSGSLQNITGGNFFWSAPPVESIFQISQKLNSLKLLKFFKGQLCKKTPKFLYFQIICWFFCWSQLLQLVFDVSTVKVFPKLRVLLVPVSFLIYICHTNFSKFFCRSD